MLINPPPQAEVVPFGGKTPTIGTNPHSWGFPTTVRILTLVVSGLGSRVSGLGSWFSGLGSRTWGEGQPALVSTRFLEGAVKCRLGFGVSFRVWGLGMVSTCFLEGAARCRLSSSRIELPHQLVRSFERPTFWPQ